VSLSLLVGSICRPFQSASLLAIGSQSSNPDLCEHPGRTTDTCKISFDSSTVRTEHRPEAYATLVFRTVERSLRAISGAGATSFALRNPFFEYRKLQPPKQKRDVKQEQHGKNRCEQLMNPFSFNDRRNDCREGEDHVKFSVQSTGQMAGKSEFLRCTES
jgi:hypothetical protein